MNSTDLKNDTLVEIAQPGRPRLRLLLQGAASVYPGGRLGLFGRKGRLDGVLLQTFATRVVLPEHVRVISTYEERCDAAKRRGAANS